MADDGWNTVPISKGNRPIDTSRLTKITKVRLGVQCGQLSLASILPCCGLQS